MSLSDLGDRAFQLIHKTTFQNKQTNKQKRERERERERKREKESKREIPMFARNHVGLQLL